MFYEQLLDLIILFAKRKENKYRSNYYEHFGFLYCYCWCYLLSF